MKRDSVLMPQSGSNAARKVKKVIFLILPRLIDKNSHPHEAVWPLSAGVSATILKQQGYSVCIIDLQAEKRLNTEEIAEKICKSGAEVLFLQYETVSFENALLLSKSIRNVRDDLCIVGFGQHAFALPEEIIGRGGADICVTADLEFVVKDLVHAIESGRLDSVRNIVYRDGKKITAIQRGNIDYNVDTLPYIDLSLLQLGKYTRKKFPKPFFWGKNWGFIRTTMGCPYNCFFCSPLLRHSIIKGYKMHSIGYIIDQIKYYKKCGINVFSMEDDVFSLDEERTVELCRRLFSLKIKWVVDGTRADKISMRVLKEMKRSGCFGIGIGVESGSDRVLNILQKGENTSQIKEAALGIKKMGFILVGYVIIGSPGETEQDLSATVSLIKEIKPHILYLHYFVPYPGSPAYNKYLGLDYRSMNHYRFNGINFSRIESISLESFMKMFYKKYYCSLSYIKEYIKIRAKYGLVDFNEWGLAVETLRFILRRGG